MKKIISSAIFTIVLLFNAKASAQGSFISNNTIESFFSYENVQHWIVTTGMGKCYNYELCEDGYSYFGPEHTTYGKIISGHMHNGYIYNMSEENNISLRLYNPNDCEKVTLTNTIPLKYGSKNGIPLDNGATMYIVPFVQGKYTITNNDYQKKLKLSNTYALIFQKPDGSSVTFLNVKKTNYGYDISNILRIYSHNGYTTNLVSTSGYLSKNIFACNNEGDCITMPYWIKEYPGFCMIEDTDSVFINYGFVVTESY